MVCFEAGGGFRVEALCLHSQASLSGVVPRLMALGSSFTALRATCSGGASKEWSGKPELCQTPLQVAPGLGLSERVCHLLLLWYICGMGLGGGTFSPLETSLRRRQGGGLVPSLLQGSDWGLLLPP